MAKEWNRRRKLDKRSIRSKRKTITGLVNGDIIYTRLYDGTSSGKYSNIEVKDITKPKIIINLNNSNIQLNHVS